MKPRLYLVAGSSGVGKTTIVSNLINAYPSHYARPHSITTRPRRPQEGDAEYQFVTSDQFDQYAARQALLNNDHVYGNSYGMLEKSVLEILDRGVNAIKEIHPDNHAAIRQKLPDSVSILLKDSEGDTRIRHDRDIDGSTYEGLDPSKFEIVCPITAGAVDSHLILHGLISALQLDMETGVHPQTIDHINHQGYSEVMPEFLDHLRLTTANFHEITTTFWRQCVDAIESNSRCLEIGVGRGWLDSATGISDKCDYTGTDLVVADVSPPGTLQSSAHTLAFPDKSFDYVVASLADPFLSNLALHQIRRVLKSGGTFHFTSPAQEWSSRLRTHSERHHTEFTLASGGRAKVYSFCHSREALARALNRAGFTKVEMSAIGLDYMVASSLISPALAEPMATVAQAPVIYTVTAK